MNDTRSVGVAGSVGCRHGARLPVAMDAPAAPLVDMKTILAILLTVSGFARSEPLSSAIQRRQNAPFGIYAGGYASAYEPAFAAAPLLRYVRPRSAARPLRHAYSHMRQQIYAASAPQVHYSRDAYAAGPVIHHPPPSAYSTPRAYVPAPTAYPKPTYATPAAYREQSAEEPGDDEYPVYAAASAWPPSGPDVLYVTEAAEQEPVYVTEAADALVLDAAEVYDSVMYARPDPRGGYTYRRRRRRPAPRPAAPRPPYIIKIKKRKIYRD